MRKLIKFLSWPIVCGILAGVIIFQYNATNGNHAGQSVIASQQPVASYAQSVQQAAPSVVNIYTRKIVKQKLPPLFDDPLFRYFLNRKNGGQKERVQRSLGSGVIMSSKGFLLTNHVI